MYVTSKFLSFVGLFFVCGAIAVKISEYLGIMYYKHKKLAHFIFFDLRGDLDALQVRGVVDFSILAKKKRQGMDDGSQKLQSQFLEYPR